MAFKAKQTYKGRPLVRSKNEIYYGNMTDPYVVFLQVITNKKAESSNDEVPDKINVMVLSTDESLPPQNRVLKQSVKSGLYNALDFGVVLLERTLAQEK